MQDRRQQGWRPTTHLAIGSSVQSATGQCRFAVRSHLAAAAALESPDKATRVQARRVGRRVEVPIGPVLPTCAAATGLSTRAPPAPNLSTLFQSVWRIAQPNGRATAAMGRPDRRRPSTAPARPTAACACRPRRGMAARGVAGRQPLEVSALGKPGHACANAIG